MLQSLDNHWKDHLLAMDHLKEGIGLRGYGQKDPKREYQREGYEMFLDMVEQVKEDVVQKICMVHVQREEELARVHQEGRGMNTFEQGGDGETGTVKRTNQKVGRNDPCPCGSGLKYKKCCGR